MSLKRLTVITCVVIFLGVFLFSGILIYQHVSTQRELEAMVEAERAEQQRIADAYVRLHYAFAVFSRTEPDGVIDSRLRSLFGQYEPILDDFAEKNPFGVDVVTYRVLRMYYHRAGILLEYETVREYFSQEFEPDGTLRLYNNSYHPEIEAFVNWAWDGRRQAEMREYLRNIERIYSIYFGANRESGFQLQNLLHLSPQMLDALARAEADPDYVLDLTSLQQQGY